VFIPSEYYSGIRSMLGGLVRDSLWMAVALTVTASLAEGLWPAVRVPAGSAYRWFGGNRWAAAAIQGAVIGATVGFLVMILQYSSWLGPDRAIESAVITAVSFACAEAVLVRIARRHQGQGTT
jgi:protein-S-isoprenylcysteine O-methyltransferase Ste14